MLKPALEEVQGLAKSYNKIPVYLEMYMDYHTPITVLSLLKEEYERYFLLESMEGGERIARYTFIGAHPKESFEIKDGVAYFSTREKLKRFDGNPMDALSKVMAQYKAPKYDGFVPFTGGAVGYFGYDIIRYSEELPKPQRDDLKASDVKLMMFDEVIAFDHFKQKMYIISNITVDEEIDIEEEYENAKNRIKYLKEIISRPVKRRKVEVPENVEFKSTITKEKFMQNVEKAKEYIANGDIFQVVPSQTFTAKMENSLFDVYRVLRTINPSPYMYLMQFDDLELAGASPELLVKTENHKITTMPIAGSRPRGKDEESDSAMEKDLLSDPKELAEHNMLVDLGRNDIGKVSDIDTVQVTEYMKVQRYSHIMHITSTVQGQLKEELNGVDALRSILPAGTLSGAPKVRAMEIIQELEEDKRGIYGGAIGYIGYEGTLDTCIAIRTLVKKDGIAYVRSGVGVVLDSNPEKEYEESVNKAMALMEAVRKVGEIV